MNNQPMLSIKNLDVHYGSIQALRKVSLNINQGEIVSIIGANGAGKSTLLNSVFNNTTITNGQIIYNGTNISILPTHKISRLKIAIVPEGRRIFSRMSVIENILLGFTASGFQNQESQVAHVFDIFPVLKERAHQQAGTLSGGEQQMLAIARALVSEPQLLLLDEPSLGLAPLVIKNIFKKLHEIAKSNTTIFLVEQNARMALKISTRGYLLVNGSIKLEDSAEKLLSNPELIEGYMGN